MRSYTAYNTHIYFFEKTQIYTILDTQQSKWLIEINF